MNQNLHVGGVGGGSLGGGRGRGGGDGALAPRLNRSSLPLVVNREDRKPLFGERQNKQPIGPKPTLVPTPHDARPSIAISASTAGSNIPRPGSVSPSPSIVSSHGVDGPSRIPRPTSAAGGAFSKSKRPMSLVDAYRLAEAQEGFADTTARMRRLSPVPIDGSPSPAPRPRPSSRASDDRKIRRMVSTGPLELGRTRYHPRPADDGLEAADDNQSIHSASSSASFERRLSQFAREANRSSISPGRATTPSSIPRPGSRHRNHHDTTNPALQKRASMSSLNSFSSLPGTPRTPEAFAKGHVPRGWVSHLLAKEEQRAVSPKPGVATKDHATSIPRPSVEKSSPRYQPTPPSARRISSDLVHNPSPDKSFAWQVDQDFTAHDLQVSDSPRLNMDQVSQGGITGRRLTNDAAFAETHGARIGSPSKSGMPIGFGRANSKLAEIRQRELDVERALATSPAQDESNPHHPVQETNHVDNLRQRETDIEDRFAQLYPEGMRKNTKLDEIRQREIEVEERFAEPAPPQEARKNTKLDEIREREKEFSSNKALAASFLDDIREHNASRSLSPDSLLHRHRQRAKESTPPEPPAQSKPKQHAPGDAGTTLAEQGEQIPDTPVTVYRKSRAAAARDEPMGTLSPHRNETAISSMPKPDEPEPVFPPAHHRADSRDLLRRLARAASTSPAPEQTPQKEAIPEKAQRDDADETSNTNRHLARGFSSNATENPPGTQSLEQGKASVDFLGIRRDPSADSLKDKRLSMALSDKSDHDPTPRIEGELRLFAPHDNQSERGSVRAPSVGAPSDKDDLDGEADGEDEGDQEEEKEEPTEQQKVDETPRPVKPDPLTLPTPKVTGAYVETPAPVKVEAPPRMMMEEDQTRDQRDQEDQKNQHENRLLSTRDKGSSSLPGKGAHTLETSSKEKSTDTADVPDVRVPGRADHPTTTTTTTSTLRRRARSLPRSRRPLKNSAKPPSVKDDLMEMRRTYQIEDSTLDDLEEIFRQNPSKLPRAPSPEIQSMLNAISTKREEAANQPGLDKVQRDSELELYDKMSKSLKDGLLGIRAAKIGIERLEDNLAHSKPLKTEDTASEAKPPPKVEKAAVSAEQKHESADVGPPSNVRRDGASSTRPSDVLASSRVPAAPRLYHKNPFRLSLVGLLVLFVSIWLAAETATCSVYCRPSTCSASEAPCYWSPDDPTWGYSLPTKLDEWVANGRGRQMAAGLAADAADLYLDAWDYIRGVDIRQVDMESLDFHEKRRIRRRLRKKGLLESYVAPDEHRGKWESWHQARVAMDRVDEMREAGYDDGMDDAETFEADEAV